MARSKALNVAVEPPADPARRRNRKVDVMDAAIDVFWRKGYAAASVQDVADSVGVLKGSLYYYIDSKEDLLFRILEDVHEGSRRILDEVVSLDATPLERVRTYIERHVEWYLDNVEEVTVYFRDWRFLTGERLDIVAERRRGYDRVVRELIVAAQRSGEVDPSIDPKYASFFVLAAVNHVPDWYRRGVGDSPADIAAAYADLTVGTLRGTQPRRPAARPRAKRAKTA
jgi:TetR/AcrR family transcriptional regulator, cholesterol catabolism regulator